MARKALILLGLIALQAAAALAQIPTPPPRPQPAADATFDIRGKLVWPMVKPPDERLEVHLEKNMLHVQTVFTDSLGGFEFRSVPPGDYYVTVKYPDYEDVNQMVVVYTMQRVTNVTIPMNPLFTVVRKRAPGFEGDDPDVVDVNMMLKTYPKKAVQEYEKGLDENKKGAIDKAIEHFQAALKIAPDFYHVENNLGVAYFKIQKYPEAEAAYRHAKELNPKAHQPALNLGILLVTLADLHRSEGREAYGKYLDEAMDALDEAIKLRPQSAMAHYFLGTAYYKSDFLDEAEASLKKAQMLDATFAKSRIMLVNVYTKQKKLKEALEQIDAFLRENPKAEERPAMEDLRQKIIKGTLAP